MKKLLLILLVLVGCFSEAQVTGYTRFDSRYNWLAGYFRALHIPAGDSAQLTPGQTERSGGIYLDTVNTTTSPAGLYMYVEGVWVLQGSPSSVDLPDALLYGGSVTYSGSGLVFNVQESIVRLCGVVYFIDSIQVTLPAADATFNKFYTIYLDNVGTGVHVLEGEPATPAAVPQVEACQWHLTEILVDAAATTPNITQTIIYNENTESVVDDLNTTTDGDNTTNVFIGAKSVNVTNINNTDAVFFTTNGVTPVTWNLANIDAISYHVKLKAVMPANANLTVQFGNGSGGTFTGVSSEVTVPLNKSSLQYQAFTTSMGAFGNLTDLSINRVRFRYLRPGNSSNYTGFYLDYIYLEDGLVVGNPGGSVTSVNISIDGNAITEGGGPVTGIGTLSLDWVGNSGQYVNGLGNLVTFPDILTDVGTLDGRSKNADGGTIDGTEYFNQTADSVYPGLLTPELWIKLNEIGSDSITNGTGGDTLLVYVNEDLLKVKSLIAGTNTTFDVTGDNITINSTGGGGTKVVHYAATNYSVAAGVTHVQVIAASVTVTLPSAAANTGREIIVSTQEYVTSISPAFIVDGTNTSTSIGETESYSFVSDGTDWNRTVLGWTYYFDDASIGGEAIYSGALWAPGDGYVIHSFKGIKGTGGITVSSDATDVTIDGSGIGGGVAWGAITGTLSDQTDLQTALNLKAPLASPTFTGTVTLPTPFTLGATSVTPTGTELNFVDGVTSAIQTQIDAKASLSTNTFTGAQTFAAGTATAGTAPQYFQSGTNLTVPVAGAVEYGTWNFLSTTASGRGYTPSTMPGVLQSDFALVDATGVQTAFSATIDTWTLQGSTTYHFWGQYNILGGTASKTIGMAFLLGGGASIHSINYSAGAWNGLANTLATSTTRCYTNQVSVQVLTVAATTAGNHIVFEGYIRMNAGGTIVPQISFGTNAPAGAVNMKAGSFIHFEPVGDHTFETFGNPG